MNSWRTCRAQASAILSPPPPPAPPRSRVAPPALPQLHNAGARAGDFIPFGPRPRLNGGGLLLEDEGAGPWDSDRGRDGSSITLRGNQRGYLVLRRAAYWQDAQFDRLRLISKTLRFTVDVSGVECGCNAAVYLVEAPQPDSSGSRYCDINSPGPERCTSINLMEANVKSIVSTLHTHAGQVDDGTCNQWGCAQGWGVGDNNCRYGRGSPNIDSSIPFDVTTRIDPSGYMRITVSQDGRSHVIWDVHSPTSMPCPLRVAEPPVMRIQSLRLLS